MGRASFTNVEASYAVSRGRQARSRQGRRDTEGRGDVTVSWPVESAVSRHPRRGSANANSCSVTETTTESYNRILRTAGTINRVRNDLHISSPLSETLVQM